jgi:WD40 repeat protein
MSHSRSSTALISALLLLAATLRAGQSPQSMAAAPDFARDVVPIFENNCLRCHNSAKQEAGLLLESYEDLMRGGDDGPPILPGRPDESPMIRQVEGHAKPKMPPKSNLAPEDIAVLRAWVAAGAKYSPPRRISLDDKVPAIAQREPLLPEVPSVAFRPDGSELAVAGYKEVRRLLLPSGAGRAGATTVRGAGATAPGRGAGALAPAISGLSDQVRAVAWSPDGRLLAAGGGVPGAYGELVLVDAATGQVLFTLDGHRDFVYHVAFSPDGRRLASCGYDRAIRIWDTTTGKATGVLKEHTEAVFAVAFSGDGRLLASGAGDRSIKIWDVAKGIRLYTITEPTDAVLTLAFRPGTSELAAGGADKRLRVWSISETSAKPIRNTLAHTAGLIRLAYSPDGSRLASTATDREIKIWDASSGRELHTLGQQRDWAQALAFSPDGRRLAVGRYDGTVTMFDAVSGRKIADLITIAEPRKVATR